MSGVTDAMRIPKDAFFAHQVMWSGWVDDEKEQTYIVGHWNYDWKKDDWKKEEGNKDEGNSKLITQNSKLIIHNLELP